MLSKIFLVSKMFFRKNMSKNNPVFRSWSNSNIGITRTSIHVQRFTEHVYDCSILNDLPIQKNWLININHHGRIFANCQILNPCSSSLLVKVWFSVFVYQTFKVFKEAMKYTLFEVTVTRLKFLHWFSFLKIWIRSEHKWLKM